MAQRNGRKQLVPVTGRGGQPQMQQVSRRSWTRAKEREFLAVLAETCNVTRACEAVGMSVRGAYKRRQRNAGFRAGWMTTLSTAYQQLELALLDRSLNGSTKIITRRDGSEERMHEFPNQLGLSLLKMHRAGVAAFEANAEMAPVDIDDLREQLMEKLERLRRRREQEGASGK